MVDQLRSFASEVTRVAREVGTDGKLGGQAIVPGVAGTWKDLTDSVNAMCGNLTDQVRNIAQVTTAVARGDLSRKITVDVRGEILELKDTINTMVDQLNAFASEVTRVAREVGTDGKLGGQAQVPGVGGTWKDLTDSVNFMAGNLTAQVRNVAEVATAVARGDLSRKITVDVSLQSDKLADTTARKLFHDARDRVRSMALVHEKLYNSHDLARVELGEYTRSLMGDLLQAHAALASKVRLRIEQDAVFVPVDVAIPCGLILNELATNALKHAFHERAEGEITIETKRLDDGRIRVVFSDDGRGLPPELDWRSADTLGLRLIRMLAEQLGGTSELCNGQGTRFELILNARSYIDDGRGEAL